MVAEYTEEIRHLHINRRGLQARLIERIDDDALGRNGLANAAV